jgi:chromosome segregation ATPase
VTGGDGGRTAAAVAARRSSTQAALAQVRDVLARMRREKTPVTVAAVSRRAGVSRTFLCSNPEARALLADATADTRARTAQDLADRDAGQEAAWRERALNAEDALKTAHAEIARQRERIGELLGQVRDLEADWTQDAIQRITTENTTLKQRVRQLTGDNRTLDERLKAARSNLRFQDRRVADLEAQLLDSPQK